MKPHTAVAVSCVTVEATRAAHGTRPGSPAGVIYPRSTAHRSVDCRPRRSGAAVRRTRAAGCGIRQVCLNSYFPNLQIQFRYTNSVLAIRLPITRVRSRQNSIAPCIGSMHTLECTIRLSGSMFDVIPPLDYRHHHIGGDCGIGDIDMTPHARLSSLIALYGLRRCLSPRHEDGAVGHCPHRRRVGGCLRSRLRSRRLKKVCLDTLLLDLAQQPVGPCGTRTRTSGEALARRVYMGKWRVRSHLGNWSAGCCHASHGVG
jgi:hypothetical protein